MHNVRVPYKRATKLFAYFTLFCMACKFFSFFFSFLYIIQKNIMCIRKRPKKENRAVKIHLPVYSKDKSLMQNVGKIET